jgi:hypothetical protein
MAAFKWNIIDKMAFQWTLLISFACVIFFINIGGTGIYSAQEGRAAIVASNMLKTGNYLNVTIKGEPETEKPIMTYWLYAVAGKIFGVNEFSVRLPSVISAIVTVILTCWLGGRIYGASTGIVAGYMLATMISFVNLGRIARIDIVLCAFYALSLLFLYLGYFEKRKPNWLLYLFYIALGLSVLVKGPVSVILAALTVLVLALRERNWRIIWELKPVSGLFIGLLINMPWYVYESVRTRGEFAFDFLWNQNIDRFLGINTTYCEGKRKTFFYYFPKLLAGALPWSLLTPFCLYSFRGKFRTLRPDTWFLLAWTLVVFFFFSLSAIKRGDYILPLYPALAILLGRYLILVSEQRPKLSRHWKTCWLSLLGIAVVAAGLLKTGVLREIGQLGVKEKIAHFTDRDGMSIIQTSDLLNQHYVLLIAAVALLLGLLYLLGKLSEQGRILPATNIFLAVMLAFLAWYYLWLDPITSEFKTTKPFCRIALTHLPENAVIGYYGSWVDEAVFYIGRDYERCSKISDFYDLEKQNFKFKFIIAPEDKAAQLPDDIKSRMEQLEKTVSGHQYPLALYRIKNQQ